MSVYTNTNIDQRIQTVSASEQPTFSDTVEFTMGDPSGEIQYQNDRYCRGFHSNADGVLAYKDPGNTGMSAVSITIKAGSYYPYAIGTFMDTGTDAAVKAAGGIIAKR